MKTIFTLGVLLVLTAVGWGAGEAADDPSQAVLLRGEAFRDSGRTTDAAACFELAMELSAGTSPQSFGQAQKAYWMAVQQGGDFPRAYSFFSRLAEQFPDSPEVLAAKASATGGYIGWLAQAGLMEPIGQERVRDLDNQARELYETALARDPDNFQALFAFAIYESYSPKGAARAQALLARLDALRDGHPHYPWAQVDQLRARLTAAK